MFRAETIVLVPFKVQQATMAGGLTYCSDKDRFIRARRVHSIREDVRMNCALWRAAVEVLNS
jgi:hypothetical protein